MIRKRQLKNPGKLIHRALPGCASRTTKKPTVPVVSIQKDMRMSDEFTTADKLASVRREVALRRGVYPKLIASKRITEPVARREIAIMESIARDYAGKIEAEQAKFI